MKLRLLLGSFSVLFIILLGCLLGGCETKPREELSWRDLTWAVGAPLPDAEDFALRLPEGIRVTYAEEYTYPSIGEYTLTLLVNGGGYKDHKVQVRFTLQRDNVPPVIEGASDLVSTEGLGISYRAGITVTDNCDDAVRLEVDSSAVNIHKQGVYPVIYTATDNAGNQTVCRVQVYVYREAVSMEDLMEKIAPIAATLCPEGASKYEKAEAIYDYVYYNVDYVSYSDKSDWIRAAYEGLRTGSGDCFTYFALSKAFFTYFGIENMDIHRTEGIVDERHYWNYVNISSDPAAPRWYHFDATPLAGATHRGCLLTDAQIRAYSEGRVSEDGVRNYFYAYDSADYPKSDTRIINHTIEP
ncbi:MAG: hypothetical protein IIX80_01125 [Clostridia bacterium]|nr:hypothetical protein [Clostridia bacterium]